MEQLNLCLETIKSSRDTSDGFGKNARGRGGGGADGAAQSMRANILYHVLDKLRPSIVACFYSLFFIVQRMGKSKA